MSSASGVHLRYFFKNEMENSRLVNSSESAAMRLIESGARNGR